MVRMRTLSNHRVSRAEFERELILARTSDGRAQSQGEGCKIRPPKCLTADQLRKSGMPSTNGPITSWGWCNRPRAWNGYGDADENGVAARR